MMRCTPILLLCVALTTACSTPRKACRKAERHMARAVWLCPDILHQDSVAMAIPATKDSLAAAPASPDLDSLLEACRALNAVLEADRHLRQEVAYTTNTPARPLYTPAHGVQLAVTKVQQAACNWQGFTQRVGRITITVRNINGAPALMVDDPGEVRKVPCPPSANKTVITGVADWYRTAFWIIVGMVVLFVFPVLFAIFSRHGF